VREGPISAQVVAEEQGVTLIGPAPLPDVQMGASLSLWGAEVEFPPFLWRIISFRWLMIVRDAFRESIPEWREGLHQWIRVEGCHSHLDVNDILGRQSWNGGRADVVDALCQVSESFA
jgi:hypothetical protein